MCWSLENSFFFLVSSPMCLTIVTSHSEIRGPWPEMMECQLSGKCLGPHQSAVSLDGLRHPTGPSLQREGVGRLLGLVHTVGFFFQKWIGGWFSSFSGHLDGFASSIFCWGSPRTQIKITGRQPLRCEQMGSSMDWPMILAAWSYCFSTLIESLLNAKCSAKCFNNIASFNSFYLILKKYQNF